LQLQAKGVQPDEVTDVFLTHAHYDHAVNFTLFPSATVWIGEQELAWAADQPPGFNPLPELYVTELMRSPRVRRVQAGDELFAGVTALAAPGHTPGHLLLYLKADTPILFTGDAAKNRAELLSREVDATGDAQASRRSIDHIWSVWQEVPGTVLIPGHDLSMTLDAQGQPQYLGSRKAGIAAWFSESIHEMHTLDLGISNGSWAAYRNP
jgi:glyoxylase-like metal-dependent hydrolase (beta-lactamase superfamily II)